jgi:hypothetical protein
MRVLQQSAAVELALLLTLLVPVATRAEMPGRGRAAAVGVPPGANDYIEYQLRPGEDPSKVARMFHVTIEELLALNHISDPRRLGVGALLRIPDPRASMLAQLRQEKDALEQQAATGQTRLNAQQQTIDDLESQATRLRRANKALQHNELLYKLWQAAVLVGVAMALILGLSLVAVRARMHVQDKRLTLANKQLEVLRIAIDKYRKLGGQFELRYQSLFHHVAPPGNVPPKAQTLRRVYEDDCTRLDAIVAEAEREITNTLGSLQPEAGPKSAKALMLRLSTVRKNG